MAMLLALMALAIVLFLLMTGAWWLSLKTGQSGWVDTIWSLGTGLFGALAALVPLDPADLAIGPTARQILIALFCAAWGARLAFHIGSRTKGSTDDPRYAKLKETWGDDYRLQMFLFLQTQAIAAFVLDTACLIAAHARGALSYVDGLAIVILVIALGGEGIADFQLRRFKANSQNRGQICDVGLWSWSRHPNYFFEWLLWCAFALPALSDPIAYPTGAFALLAPVMMYVLLVHVSGIPPLEAHMQASRGERFDRYKARVSAFWPMPPRD